MAELSNPQLVSYCNENLRPLSDKLALLLRESEKALAVYTARNLASIISASGSTNVVADGSEMDGRTRVTGDDVNNLVGILNAMNTFMTQARKDIVNKWRVHE